MKITQPEGYPDCYSFQHAVRGGRKSKGRLRQVRIEVPARLRVPVDRFNAGMTTGGSYHLYSNTDPAGAACSVIGFWGDGTAHVIMPGGGVGKLSMADVEITGWPVEVDAEERAHYELLEANAPHAHSFGEPPPEVFKVQRREGRHTYCKGCQRWRYEKVAA
jgi:hypothetical protein